jgi:ribosomal protein S1
MVTERYPAGSRVTGKVVRLTDFGAFVELEPGVDGLLHISQLSERPVSRPEDIVNVGDELTLVVIRVDPTERRIGLSLKELAAAIEREQVQEYKGRPRKRRRGGADEAAEEEEE